MLYFGEIIKSVFFIGSVEEEGGTFRRAEQNYPTPVKISLN
ncbi:hypothetical protein BECAL_02043 [Bellilinea caldifistulae]|nr:hypothetical protein BECAL_02043 [Bellilinea caldifistulae]